MYFCHTIEYPYLNYAHHCTLKNFTLGCCYHKRRKIFVLICVINITMSVFQKVFEVGVIISVDEIHQSLETYHGSSFLVLKKQGK